jgi:Mlc titration factor MtfA (ptsG expression regulator)
MKIPYPHPATAGALQGPEALGLVLFAIAVAILWVWRTRVAKRERRRELRAKTFPEAWKSILEKNLHAYSVMPEEVKEQLHGHMHVFLHEKRFEGCGGLTLTEEMRVTIAAQACLLLLNRETNYFPKLTTVLVYPGSFIGEDVLGQDGMMVEDSPRAGEAWFSGPVVISWGDFVRETGVPGSKSNVITHEFAHRLDFEDGIADGTPILGDRRHYSSWAKVLGREYKVLREKTEKAKRTMLDKYGATDPMEFFAVVTESFFEAPQRLKRVHPELYEVFRTFYKIDPAAWFESKH